MEAPSSAARKCQSADGHRAPARHTVKRTHSRKTVVLALVSLALAVGAAGLLEPEVQDRPVLDRPRPEPESLRAPALESAPAWVSRQRQVATRLASGAAEAPASFVETAAFSRMEGPRSVPEEASTPRESAPGAGVSLPPSHLETAADGFPASGLRCSRQGDGFKCGACQTDSDCPAGKGCVANRETRLFECLESECEEDVHCFPGLVCRRASRSTGALIRRCVPVGTRREGEMCDTQFVSVAGACQEGLLCHRGRCSIPCRLGDAASCPPGHACEDDEDGAACFPDCRVLDCPGGQRCKFLGDEEYKCLEEVHGECPETPCAEGERCNMRVERGRGVFWCARLCDPLRPDSCAANEICGVGGGTVNTCYRRCDPMDPDSCGEGGRCSTSSEDMSRWGCVPRGASSL